MAGEAFTSSAVYINGSLLTYESQVTISRKSGAQNVFTKARGFAGQSPGAPMMEVTITNAVPAAGFEFDPGSTMKNTVPVALSIFAAQGVMTVTAFVDSDEFKHAVEQAATLDIKFTTTFGEWQ